MALFAPTQDAQLPSFGASDYPESTEYPVAQPQAAAHGVATHAAWDPTLGAYSLPTLVFRSPFPCRSFGLLPTPTTSVFGDPYPLTILAFRPTVACRYFGACIGERRKILRATR